jgi:chitinase
MASTQGNRAAFISSLMSFMSQYGFQGVDLGKFTIVLSISYVNIAD